MTLQDSKKETLWRAVEKWIQEHKVSCPESIYQVDSVNLSLPDLAEAVCEIVGYYKYEDEEDE